MPERDLQEPARPDVAAPLAAPSRSTLDGPAMALALQRSAGNASVTRYLSRRTLARAPTPALAPPPGAPPSGDPLPPAPTRYADRAAFMAGVTAANLKPNDDWGAVQFLNGQSLQEMADIVGELRFTHPEVLTRLRRSVGGTPDVARDRVSVVLDAGLMMGKQGRMTFDAEHTRELVPLVTADATGVKRVLDLLGPEVPEVEEMKRCAGYLALAVEERGQLAMLVGGSTTVSGGQAAAMRKLLDDPKLDKSQPEPFRKFLGGEGQLKLLVGLSDHQRLPADAFTVKPAVDAAAHPYRSGAADALRTPVEIKGKKPDGSELIQTIDIFAPKTFTPEKPGMKLPPAADVAQVLAEMPPHLRQNLVRVDLHPKRNPDDAFWNKQPGYAKSGGGDFRSFMTAGSDGIVDVFPSGGDTSLETLESSLLHESGHIVSGKAWGDDAKDAKWDPWRAAMKKDGVKLSKYATASEAEDFSEAWNLFSQAYGKPREPEVRALIPARFVLMEGLAKKAP